MSAVPAKLATAGALALAGAATGAGTAGDCDSARGVGAAVLAAGHCGFGLGATPTAIANMQAITDRFGPSHMAFLVVPMVGAFFIDIVNALVIKLYLLLPMFG